MGRSVQSVVAEPEASGSESSLPPGAEAHLAAIRRLNREPGLLDGYEEGTWVAFSGERIVAAGAILEDVIDAARAAGEPNPLMMPILPDPYLGL